ncbi:ferritin subunit-like [Copidosoma floridanum]|nr:ferritin subunit-like [Copidosoma floridanum]
MPVNNIPEDWRKMNDPCVAILKKQVKSELTVAMSYLAMGAYFSRDTVNRPGFSEFFLKSASEEREHGIKIMEYLLMRGQLTSDVTELLTRVPRVERHTWHTGVEALTEALKLEQEVTARIRRIIETCESKDFNDYHLVDYLTAEFLTEQYKGQRDLAGKISTLGKMTASQKALGEFLFDKKLLNNQL